MPTIHLFNALDGRRLDGRKGACGVEHIAWHHNDTYDGPDLQFYGGAAAAHAVMMNTRHLTPDSLGYLGSFVGTGIFFEPLTLKEVRFPDRVVFDDPDVRQEHLWQGQTHVAWDPDNPRVFIAPRVDGYFWKYDLDNPKHPERLGRYLVDIPHALKRYKKWLVYGAMDSNTNGPARCIGIYDLETNLARIVNLRETGWHLTVADDDQGQPCAWVVSECYEQGPAKPGQRFNYDDLAIGFRVNFVWKINLRTREIMLKAAEADKPSQLSSDAIALGDTRGTVLHSCPASATIGISEVNTGRIRYIDERVGVTWLARHPGLLRSVGSNHVAAGSMMHLFGNTHHLINALLASRWPRNFSDGSYGLVLNPERTRLFSGHRGKNETTVYDFTALREDDEGPFVKLPVVERIPSPPLRKYFPKHVSILGDPRVGKHHMTYLLEGYAPTGGK